MKLAVVVMAAGMGARMNSKTPQALQPILGRQMLGHILAAVKPLHPVETVVVGELEADRARAEFGDQAIFAVQSPPSDAGYAAQQARALLDGKAEAILVLPGNMPLLSTQTLQRLMTLYQSGRGPLAMLTVERPNPLGFARIIRDEQGYVQAIVEEAACAPEQKAMREVNTGVYVFEAAWLWENLAEISLSAKEEYYVTDLIRLAVKLGQPIQAELLADPVEALEVNNCAHLAEVEAVLRQKVNQKWMEAGVTMLDPATTYIELDVTIGPDTVIYPNTYLLGQTTIGRDCFIGPNSFILDSTVGNNCKARFSVVEQSVLEDHVGVGPFSHLRNGAHLAKDVYMGNFGEVKNSYLGPGTKMGHFSYLGDTTTGKNVNIGAGAITCNFDGVKKHPTHIDDGAFIGSDTMLVAPVNVGKNAKTGAGSVVTKDVPADALVRGVPAQVKK
ncbi:MAG: UDP-N-acetylglucosamine diphosphorylase/glucosamine-1-phosphate N-acetyltransferase [Dehalococcoidia bacterium]|nr:MAG: UDP-N-acetylglucosamine diphosphorylase/glucosamine-1-phosphate N-acetyltransferase [Dehalococcoidia bacterium]